MRKFVADATFVKQDFTISRLPKADYENCVFTDCQFQEGYLDNQQFVECQFIDCDLTNANIAHTQFNTVLFHGCKLVGLHFELCDPLLFSATFNSCNLSLSCFYEMELSKMEFVDCKMHGTDFGMTNLSSSIFDGCDLKNALFENTNLRNTNFSTAINYSIDPNRNSIKKAIFNSQGLSGLLKIYDIVIV